ncbi:hypothetical protein HK100_004228 [Physocladia obscura]|uniref:Uncharacterized protein n=1 Tax=Physocladia obscura TaxID=109957 RepID=A0AAD5SVN4_9FUNG|nr:hypothetical protein HK100_004228 [Physocladia obscura]
MSAPVPPRPIQMNVESPKGNGGRGLYLIAGGAVLLGLVLSIAGSALASWYTASYGDGFSFEIGPFVGKYCEYGYCVTQGIEGASGYGNYQGLRASAIIADLLGFIILGAIFANLQPIASKTTKLVLLGSSAAFAFFLLLAVILGAVFKSNLNDLVAGTYSFTFGAGWYVEIFAFIVALGGAAVSFLAVRADGF